MVEKTIDITLMFLAALVAGVYIWYALSLYLGVPFIWDIRLWRKDG